MMTIANCPECHDEVRVPTDASNQATVACPWCGAQFELSSVLSEIPPLLIVINDPQRKATGTSPIVIDTGETSEAPMFDFEEREAPQAEPVSTMVTPTISSRPRPQPKGGGLITAVAVLFGGLCAIPLAQLCLWWIFGQDPVEAGPQVAKYAAFVVPKKFRGPTDPGTDLKSAAGPIRESNLGGSEGRFRETGQSNSTDGNSVGRSQERVNPPSGDLRQPVESGLGGGRLSQVPAPQAAGDLTSIARPALLEVLGDTEIDDIDEAVRQVLSDYEIWAEAERLSDSERSSQLQRFYDNYRVLGHRLAQVDPTTPDNNSRLGLADETLRRQLVGEKLLRFLGNKAKQELDGDFDVEAPGIALAGRLQSIEQVGEFWRLRVRLGESKPKVVDVMAWLPPPTSLQPGDDIVVLGRRVNDEIAAQWKSEGENVEPILGGYLSIVSKN